MARRASRSYSDKTVNMNVNNPISNPFTKLSNTQFRNCSSLLDHAVFRHALVRKGLSSNLLCARDNSSVVLRFSRKALLCLLILRTLGSWRHDIQTEKRSILCQVRKVSGVTIAQF